MTESDKTKSVVINNCYGGFGLSEKARTLYYEKTKRSWMGSREDPVLIEIVRELGEAANGACAELKIVEIPYDVDYEIAEYDGVEHIAEKHRKWY